MATCVMHVPPRSMSWLIETAAHAVNVASGRGLILLNLIEGFLPMCGGLGFPFPRFWLREDGGVPRTLSCS